MPSAWDPRSAKDQRVTWVIWIGGGVDSPWAGAGKVGREGPLASDAPLGSTQLPKCVGLGPSGQGPLVRRAQRSLGPRPPCALAFSAHLFIFRAGKWICNAPSECLSPGECGTHE